MKKAVKFLPMIIVMIIIYVFSSFGGDDSGEQSGLILEAVKKLYEEVAKGGLSPEALYVIHILIRKCAHFTEYALLGVSTRYAMKEFTKKSWLTVSIPVAVSFLYACTDEIHQYFVPGRCGTFSDVLIDTAGALTGTLVYFLISARKSKNIIRKSKAEI